MRGVLPSYKVIVPMILPKQVDVGYRWLGCVNKTLVKLSGNYSLKAVGKKTGRFGPPKIQVQDNSGGLENSSTGQ